MPAMKGGEKLTKKLQDMAGKVTSAETVKVGFLSGATYPNGTSVAMIGAIHNFGAPRAGIPPRPFFTHMIQNKKREWGPATGALLIANGYDARRSLQLLGEGVAGQLRESIIETNAPPLKPATIVRKGGTRGMVYDPKDSSTFPAKPLVHTGHMLGSVDYEVNA